MSFYKDIVDFTIISLPVARIIARSCGCVINTRGQKKNYATIMQQLALDACRIKAIENELMMIIDE